MVPAILILTFAWTLKSMTDSLGAAEFVASVMNSAAGGLLNLLPAIIFLVGCFLAFATGTSWGTFGISDSNRSCSIPGYKRDNDDHFHLSLYGRSCMRRSLFTNFRYNNYGFRRSTVQSCKSRINTVAICNDSCSCFMYHICDCRCDTECGYLPGNRNCIADFGASCNSKPYKK